MFDYVSLHHYVCLCIALTTVDDMQVSCVRLSDCISVYVCLCTVLTTGDNMQVSCGVRLSGSVFMYLSVCLSVHCSEPGHLLRSSV